eukprot:3206727-Pyramimonas_sp.AAC.1
MYATAGGALGRQQPAGAQRTRALRTLQAYVADLRLTHLKRNAQACQRAWAHLVHLMGGHGRDGRLRARIDEHMAGHITYLLTCISVQPVLR